MKNGRTITAYLLLVGAVALWGGNWVAVRFAVQAMHPLLVVTIRSILSTVILLVVLLFSNRQKPQKGELWKFALLGLIGLFGFNLFQHLGLKSTTAINGSLINSATPILIIILSRFILREKLNSVQLAGVIISFLGVGWVITKGSLAVIQSVKLNSGDLLTFIAAAFWALYTIYSRKPTLQYSALTVTAYASVFASIYFAPIGLTQYYQTPVQTFSWGLFFALSYTITVAVLGLVAWIKGVSIIGPSKASIFMNLMPVFTFIFAYIFLDETITLSQLVGGIFVVGGVYLTNKYK